MIIETGHAISPSSAVVSMIVKSEQIREKIIKQLLLEHGTVCKFSFMSKNTANSAANKTYRTIAGWKQLVQELEVFDLGELAKGHFHLFSEPTATLSTKSLVYAFHC